MNNVNVYLAAGQVQGSVPVLIQQCQVSLGSVKEDRWTTQRHLFPVTTDDPNLIIIVKGDAQQTYSSLLQE